MTTKTEEYFVSVTYLKLNLWSVRNILNVKLLWLNFPSQQTTVKGRENPTFSFSCSLCLVCSCVGVKLEMLCNSDPNLDHNPRGGYSRI